MGEVKQRVNKIGYVGILKKVLIFPSLILIIALAFYFSFLDYESCSSEKVSFVINKPYLTIIKDLAKKESLEKTIEDNDGKLVYKEWKNFVVEIPKKILRLREYKLEGKLDFVVEKKDNNLGNLRIPFEQNIHIDKQIFTIKTNLSEPQKNILAYNKVVEMGPSTLDGVGTQVEINSELRIKKLIPFFLKEFMDKKVKEENQKDLEKLKKNLLNITQDSSPVGYRVIKKYEIMSIDMN